jgi:hypothetical protein
MKLGTTKPFLMFDTLQAVDYREVSKVLAAGIKSLSGIQALATY